MKIDLTKEEIQVVLKSLAVRSWQEVEPLMHKLSPLLEEGKDDNNKDTK